MTTGKETVNMPKYYAVRSGYHTGIFKTWEECRKEVNGYSRAEFKSFNTIAEAKKYIAAGEQISLTEENDTPDRQLSLIEEAASTNTNTALAYVDGSYNKWDKRFGCGVVIFYGGKKITFSRAFDNADLAQMHNVAGEIEGAKLAMQWCIDNNIEEIDIYYDYEGIEKWCTGEWKTNREGTIAYKHFYESVKKKLKISFNKVKGHSGDRFNDMADALAKQAVGIE